MRNEFYIYEEIRKSIVQNRSDVSSVVRPPTITILPPFEEKKDCNNE